VKFLVTQELKHNPLLKLVVLFLLGILAIFLLTDLVLYHLQIGLTLEQASQTLLGNEEVFIEPLLFDVLLERLHIGIFTSMITLILLSIIYMRVQNTQKSSVIHLVFITAILAPLSLLLAYFYGTAFIVTWIGLFILWHLVALYLAFVTMWSLVKR
jgi:hypothetical protein